MSLRTPLPATDGLSPWALLGGPDLVEVREPSVAAVANLVAGTRVALVSGRLFARPWLRRIATEAGVVVDRELIVVRAAGRVIVVLDDEELAVRHFWDSVVTVPPGAAVTSLSLAVGVGLGRALPWRWTGLVVPGRVLLGTRR